MNEYFDNCSRILYVTPAREAEIHRLCQADPDYPFKTYRKYGIGEIELRTTALPIISRWYRCHACGWTHDYVAMVQECGGCRMRGTLHIHNDADGETR